MPDTGPSKAISLLMLYRQLWQRLCVLFHTRPGDEQSARQTIRNLTVVVLLLIWGVFAEWAFYQHSSERNNMSQVLDRQRAAAQAEVESLLRPVRMFLHQAELWIAQHPQRDPRDDREFLAMVELFYRDTGNSVLIRLAAADGTLHLLPAEAGAGKPANVSDREYFQQALVQAQGKRVLPRSGKPDSFAGIPDSHLFIGQPFLGRVSGHWGMPMALGLRQPSHNLVVIFAHVEMAALHTLLQRQRLYQQGRVELIRSDGLLLASSDGTTTRLGQSRLNSNLFSKGLPQAGEAGIVGEAEAGVGGESHLLAYGEHQSFPLITVVGISEATLLAHWQQQTLQVGFLLVIFTVIILVISWRSLRLLDALHDSRVALKLLATTDSLTGLMNRRRILECCTQELERARRYQTTFSVAILDLDSFKRINDNYGHQTGDLVLQRFAHTCHHQLRDSDRLGRQGGEEFVLLLPGTPLSQAVEAVERIRLAVMHCEVSLERRQGGTGEPVHFTVSAGVSEWHPDDTRIEHLLARSDKALYQAKHAGRNRTMALAAEATHSQPTPPALPV